MVAEISLMAQFVYNSLTVYSNYVSLFGVEIILLTNGYSTALSRLLLYKIDHRLHRMQACLSRIIRASQNSIQLTPNILFLL